jgi:predicted metal-dependent TIM-barrel fold hydrolase
LFVTPIFDAQIHAGGLSDQDLNDLRFFGVGGALCVCGDDVPEATAEALLADFDARVNGDSARLRRVGLEPFLALGIHPARVPERGLEGVLARLAALLGAPRVVAVGAVGLDAGGPAEEAAFARQLELARDLRRRVIVHTPVRDKPRLTRRVLAMVRESGIDPGRVLVTDVDARTVKAARACGHHVGLMVHPARISGEEAVRLVRKLGSGNLLLGSDAGRGPGDLLALPRTAMLLEKAGLSAEIIRRVCRENALAFLGLS